MRIAALCGGAGGAKLAYGLYELASSLDLVVNTGHDFDHYGLRICPDLDTLACTLSGKADSGQGCGRKRESFSVQSELKALAEDIWFQLGDKDIATHLLRLKLLSQGKPLTEATHVLATRLGVKCRLLPMTDNTAETLVDTDEGILTFQQYSAARKCAPFVRALRYGAANAIPSSSVMGTLLHQDLAGLIICPSNPLLSIGPILAMPAVRSALRNRRVPALAVSPLIGSGAAEDPTTKMMRELRHDTSAAAVARLYQGLIDLFVLDEHDASEADDIRALGIPR